MGRSLIKSVGLVFRWLLGAAVVWGLSACSAPTAEDYPPQDDYCAEIGRNLSDGERLEKALDHAFDDESLYHFQEFKVRILIQSDDEGRDEIIARYLDAYPDCCGVFPPAYLFEDWAPTVVESEADLGMLDDWNRDVKIARYEKNFGSLLNERLGTNHWHHRMNACGEIKKIDRG